MKRCTTIMTTEELRTFRKYLRMRELDYQHAIEECKKSILRDPSDKNLEYQFSFIQQCGMQIDAIWKLSGEARFDIEDITEEEEPLMPSID